MTERTIRTITLLAVLSLGLVAGSCKKEPVKPVDEDMVENASVPESFTVHVGDKVRISGEGFMMGDIILIDDGDVQVYADVTDVGADFAEFAVPDGLVSGGSYWLFLDREDGQQKLGSTVFNIITEKHYTVTGTVKSLGTPVEGVWVSDGYVWSKTDAEGKYGLESEKFLGYVFMVIPSGYDAATTADKFPDFWTTLTKASAVPETADFDLVPADNDNHIMVLTADWHMANRLGDTGMLGTSYKTEMRQLESSAGVPVYELALGDLSWDSFWYTGQFYPKTWRSLNDDSRHHIFTAIGNHDFNFKVSGTSAHYEGSKEYREALGPMYYSMNLGKVHYIVIDNIYYRNSDGTTSGRNPAETITKEQISWLREDLSHIDKSTPVVIASHAPYNRLNFSGSSWTTGQVTSNAQDALSLLSEFEHVQIVAGHRHVNNFMDLKAEGRSYAKNEMIEHTIPATSGTMWITSRDCGYNICTDGVAQCYKYFRANGKNIQWQLKCFGESADVQMRFYDMNKVKAFWDSSADAAKLIAYNSKYSYTSLFGAYEANSVMVNVFAGDPRQSNMKVRMFQGSKELTVSVTGYYDPQHVACYEIPEYASYGSINSSYVSQRCSHMFRAVASDATSPVRVEVTDRFGHTYSQTFERPKAFDKSIKY